jgi:bifunctional pyridoxal-dependent enzyme with beta-cystathionase and maltose regulon repressor activities
MAFEPVSEKEILILPGVAAVLDALTWAICNDGEGIITPAPFYTGFKGMVSGRARGVLIPATFQCLQGYRGLDDVFDPEMNGKALEHALLRASPEGVIVKAVLISKYDNPNSEVTYSSEVLI